MTTHATGYAHYQGINLAWESRGSGPTSFVLVPFLGVFGRSAVATFPGLRGALGALSREGKVTIYDPRGTGSSSPGPVPTTVRELGEDLENVIQASESGPAWLLVHFDGAAAALELATRRPDLVAGMLFDSSCPRFGVADGFPQGAMRATVARLSEAFGVDREKGFAAILRDYYDLPALAATDAAARQLRGLDEEARTQLPHFFLDFDVRNLLKASIVPVLVTHGDRNPLVPISAARYLATHLGNKDFMQFDNSGHFLMNTRSEQWVEAVRRFVRRRSTFRVG